MTQENIKKLRMFINTTKRIEHGIKMPKNIENIIDEMCTEYEMKVAYEK